MITEFQYNLQLPHLLNHLTRLPSIKSVQQEIIHETSSHEKHIIKGTINPTQSTSSSPSSPSLINFMIRYNDNYNQPILYFQLLIPHFSKDHDFEFESLKLTYSSNDIEQLFLKSKYNLHFSLVQINEQNWWFLHPCNTNDFLQNSSKENFLIDWFVIYGGCLIEIRVDDWF